MGGRHVNAGIGKCPDRLNWPVSCHYWQSKTSNPILNSDNCITTLRVPCGFQGNTICGQELHEVTNHAHPGFKA